MTINDISRLLQQPRKRYVGVRLQQGRLLTDADFNEGSWLRGEDRREVLVDLIGPRTSPNQGFSIGAPFTGPVPEQSEPLSPEMPLVPVTDLKLGEDIVSARNVSIRAGSFYIGGQRVDLERPELLLFQGDFLQMRPENIPVIPVPVADEKIVFRELFYLHLWEQCVSGVEDPEILESALDGADTSARVRRMRRVEVAGNLGPRQNLCRTAWNSVIARLEGGTGDLDRQTGEMKSRGRLQVLFADESESSDCGDCVPDPGSRFLGADHQTIRIQLTQKGFVWALDNASPIYRVRVFGLDTDSPVEVVVEMLTPPPDELHWPLTNRVIEVIPFGAVLEGGPPPADADPHFRKAAAEFGVFTRVATPYDPDTRSFTLDPGVGLQDLKRLVFQWDERHPHAAELQGSTPEERFFYIRMWHEAPSPEEVELPRGHDEHTPTLRGTTLIPIFHANGRPGDYWVVAHRPGLPERVVPFDLMREGGVPPHGPRHFYAPLALLEGENNVVTSNADCRLHLRPLSDKGCVTFTVGDGVSSFGDFTSIQDAVDAAPDGGRIQVRTGLYRERIILQDRHDLVIEGCGEGTVIETPLTSSPVSDPFLAIIDIDRSDGISISGVSLHAVEQHALLVRNTSDNVTISSISVLAGIRVGTRFTQGVQTGLVPLILVQDATNVTLTDLIMEPVARPAISVTDTDFIRIANVTSVGLSNTDVSPTPVMVSVNGANEVDIRDSVLSCFGQVGIELGSTVENARIRGVSIVSSRNLNTRSQRVTQSQSAISVNGATHVAIEENSVLVEGTPSEHAAIVALGKDLLIRANRIEVLAGCADSPLSAGVITSPPKLIVASPTSPTSPRSPSAFRSPTSPSRSVVATSPAAVAAAAVTSPVSSPLRGVAAAALNIAGCPDPHVLAWGGIQIRGLSERIEITENHVIGGIGHGVTIGSIVWRTRADVTAVRIGAGRGQIQALANGTRAVTGLVPASFRDERRRYFFASDEGSIRDLVITNNRIEQMLANGISVISVLGIPGGDFIDIDRARIEHNTITNNVQRPAETVGTRGEVFPGDTVPHGSGTLIPVLPFGGIVLGTVTSGIEIRGNTIVGNGTSTVVPINGIFVLNGDGITIAENRITGNGGRASPTLALRPGVRAGIAVMLAGTGTIRTEEEVAVLLTSPVRNSTLDALGFDTTGASLRVLNNYVVHPEGRALHALATGPVAIDGNSFASFGNHGANVAGDQFGVGDVVLVQNFGPPWEDENPTFGTPFLVSPRSPVEQYLKNFPRNTRRLFIGDGGGTLFNNNQVTFDWAVQRLASPGLRAPVAFFPVALLSLDHLGVEGNQFAFRLRGLPPGARFTSPVLGFSEPVLAQALFVGGTVQVGGNRFAETLRSTILSMLAIAHLMQISTYNQCTHQILVTTARNLRRFTPTIDSPGIDFLNAPGQLQVSRIADQVMFSNNNLQAGMRNLRAVALTFLDLLLDTR